MSDKDIIMITTKDGKEEQMEAVMTFKLEQFPHEYLIYRPLNDTSKNYLARYTSDNDTAYLDTDLLEEELLLAEEILKKVTLDGNK